MRDDLCEVEKCRRGIKFNYEFIEENREDIDNLKEDIKNGIQRYPRDNYRIIEARYFRNFLYYLKNMRSKYSIGERIYTIETDFIGALHDLEKVDEREIGFLNLFWMNALGVLLETDKENIKKLAKIV